jgi:hypothetical protein
MPVSNSGEPAMTGETRPYRRYKRVPTDLVCFFGRLVGEALSWRELVMGVLTDSVVVVVWPSEL